MPKTEINYEKCSIYKIVCNDINIEDSYIGNTTELIKRKCKHKNNCINSNSKEYNLKLYEFIRSNGGWNNWSMIKIEKYPCMDGHEARARERYWFEQLKPTLNIRNPIYLEPLRKCRPEYTKPCIYKYPDYYKHCKISTFDEIKKRNEEYYIKKQQKD